MKSMVPSFLWSWLKAQFEKAGAFLKSPWYTEFHEKCVIPRTFSEYDQIGHLRLSWSKVT
jgi:hypothetical protein